MCCVHRYVHCTSYVCMNDVSADLFLAGLSHWWCMKRGTVQRTSDLSGSAVQRGDNKGEVYRDIQRYTEICRGMQRYTEVCRDMYNTLL